ncbi:tyrosine protein phosphatase 1 [Coemansia javaensis]|uniref:Tyrosine protein phosphatase 1 n=1 Tax=Coemansia javaensis TaxID=2761396 RepID=A0A9W8HAK1_9FUNG|nr:tyrosine protein phosphatase 1 [Coemansia javaensis]
MMTSASFLQLLDALPRQAVQQSLAATFREEAQRDRERMAQALEQADEPGAVSLSDAQRGQNYNLNRYADMLPFNHNRVRLQGKHDYINASHIALPEQVGRARYIATQGPLPHTVGDFWRMVWEQRAPAVVMLARTHEARRKKCEAYWPPAVGRALNAPGDVSVTLLSEAPLDGCDDVVVRRLELRPRAGPPRTVTQLHFTAWPDEGVPASPLPLLALIAELHRLAAPAPDAPVVVHCSAGVGRTGTFIVLDAAARYFADHADYPGDLVADTFRSLRSQRTTMVQMPGQFVFCYHAILFMLANRR